MKEFIIIAVHIMPTTLEEFFKQAQEQIQIFDAWATKHQLTDIVTADHFGYKCANADEFEQMRKLFEKNSDFIFQSIISKRRIAIIKLVTPIETSCGPLFFFELSDQKPDGSQKSGFDHIEFYPQEGSEQELIKYLENKNVVINKVVRPHHTTHDIAITDNFTARVEATSLIKKIVSEQQLNSYN